MVTNSSQVLLYYREVANPDGVLQQSLEADGPAGHSPLSVAPVTLDAGQAGITVEAVVTAAALQLHAVQLCSQTYAQKSNCCVSKGWDVHVYLFTIFTIIDAVFGPISFINSTWKYSRQIKINMKLHVCVHNSIIRVKTGG